MMKNLRTQIIALVVLMVVFTIGTSLAQASTMQESASGRTLVQGDSACAISVEIIGGGSINVLRGDQTSELLKYTTNSLDGACGEVVSVTAAPHEGWRFVGWDGDLTGNDPLAQLTITTASHIRAQFEAADILAVPVDQPYEFHGRQVTETAIPNPAWAPARSLDHTPTVAEAVDPVINVWYGTEQDFLNGPAQKWVNILGNVSDGDDDITSLTYSLNGGPAKDVYIGTGVKTDRRLVAKGDFNIEIDRSSLNSGLNSVVIKALDTLGGSDEVTVAVNYNGTSVWPLPYTINWSTVTNSNLQDFTQIVDGNWIVDSGSLRPAVMGYDRIVAIGGINWQDFEAQVPITVYGTDPSAYNNISISPGIGTIIRWQGHTDTPITCAPPMPHCGWEPDGASAWYDFGKPGSITPEFRLDSKSDGSKTISTNVTYIWKVRVETQLDNSSKYSFKVWPQGTTEPATWFLIHSEPAETASLKTGSLLLVAHHVDAAFGNVSIQKLDNVEDDIPPVISNIQVVANQDRATFTWDTDEPATSLVQIAFGGGSASDSTLKLKHSLTVTGLQPDTSYEYRLTSADADNNSTSTNLMSFKTLPLAKFVSDDFNYCGPLDPVWEWVNPLNDSSYKLNGETIAISVPAGISHDIWPSDDPNEPINRAPRIMQDVNKIDDMIVKFQNGLANTIEVQGIVIEQDEDTMLRANFQQEGNTTWVYVIKIVDGSPSIVQRRNFNGAKASGPLYMRVTHSGDNWNVTYSLDSLTWVDNGSFNFPMTVTKAGVFVGNSPPAGAEGPIPGHTAYVDFAFNGNSPINPEDAIPNFLPINIVGHGKVNKNKECGNPVTLTAVPDNNWSFDDWSGSTIDGQTDPVQVVSFGTGDVVTANFSTTFPQFNLNITIQNIGEGTGGTVTKNPDYDTFINGDVVTLTAAPAPHWNFTGWSGAVSGTNLVRNVTISGETNVTATFTQERFKINTQVIGQGQILKNPNKADYAFGEQVSLTAVPAPGFAFAGWSGGLSGNPTTINVTQDVNVTATFTVSSGNPTSDDFNSCALKNYWTWVAPIGDSQLQLTGTQAKITVPSSDAHTLWEGTRTAPRIMQTAENINFEYEAKFESPVTNKYQMEGIIIEQGSNNYLRIEILYDGAKPNVFAARFAGGTIQGFKLTKIPVSDTYWLRVSRVGDNFTVSYSTNGSNWNTATTFNHPMDVKQVGVYAGNDTPDDGTTPPPPFTAVIDYFFNNAAPISPEDGKEPSIKLNVVGNGSVNRNIRPPYVCGDQVRLTANPGPGWFFKDWSGDASGRVNPLTVSVDVDMNITATFTQTPQAAPGTYLPMIIRP